MFPGDEGGEGESSWILASRQPHWVISGRRERERERGGRGREGEREREREGERERGREGERERERCLASKGILAGSTDDSFATFVC